MITGYANISGWVMFMGQKDSFNMTINLGSPDQRMELLHTKCMNAHSYEVTIKMHAHVGIFPIDWEKTYTNGKDCSKENSFQLLSDNKNNKE